MSSLLEIDVQPELNDPWNIQLRTQHTEGLWRLQAHRRVAKLHGVERVEKLRAKQSAPTLVDFESPGKRDIQIPPRQTAQLASAGAGSVDADHGGAEGVENGQGIGEEVQTRATRGGAAIDTHLRFGVTGDAGVDAVAERIGSGQDRAARVGAATLPELLARAGCDLQRQPARDGEKGAQSTIPARDSSRGHGRACRMAARRPIAD